MTQQPPRPSSARPRRVPAAVGMLFGGACIVAFCLIVRHYALNESASAEPVRRPAPAPARSAVTPVAARTAPAASQPAAPAAVEPGASISVVASVNGEEITRNELAQECLKHYGEATLQDLVNRHLIVEECKRQKINITQADVNAEIERLARGFSLPVEHWLNMLKEERGVSPKQYSEMIWQILAMRALAGSRLEVTPQELREQFERQYGEAVKARMIVLNDRKSAEQVRAAAAAAPEQFGKLAREKSVDGPSASLEGLVQPIRRHSGPQAIEEAAFALEDGEISQVISVADQYVILKREGLQPAARVSLEQVKMRMIEVIRDEKSRRVAHEILRELQDRAQVVNVMNDPAKSGQMPGVAALVNGQKLPVRDVAEVCLDRHGQDVLQGMIGRRLLEQACKQHKIAVNDEEIDQEIARAAARQLPLKSDGSPDVDRWLELVTGEQNVSVDIYRHDAVWPSVALQKLAGQHVEVTEEDLKRGYEANYGPRARCLAIVLDDLRRAQKVWQMARDNPTEEFFGELAVQYSLDPGSQALRGEVPPIHRHGGQPELEKAAFSLEAGEISGILDVGPNRWVILYGQGLTKPVIDVDFASVRELIHEEVREKKLRIAMGEYFEKLQSTATIDNYLAGTVQSPAKADALRAATRPVVGAPTRR